MAAAHHDAAVLHSQRMASFRLAVPLHERAIAEAYRAAAGDARDLVARPPEGAVHESHRAAIRRPNDHHGRVRTAERHKLTVGDQDTEPWARVHCHSRVAIVRPDAQEVAVAETFLGFDEPVADV